MKMTSRVSLSILPLLILPSLLVPTLTAGCVIPSCCLPDQFQVVLTDLEEVNKPIHTFSKLAIDYKAEKMVFLHYLRDTTATPFTETFVKRQMLDYRAGVEKSYFTDASGSCTSRSDPMKPLKCVPADSVCLGDLYMGFNVGGMRASFYRFSINGSSDAMTIGFHRQRVLSSSEDICVPLVQVVAHPNNPAKGKSAILTGFEPCLSHDFNMTAGC